MNKIIEPNFELKMIGFEFLGRSSKATGGSLGWSRSENIIYRCAKCGSTMLASYNDYWNCECEAVHLDIHAGRFGSNYGDENILVYKKNILKNIKEIINNDFSTFEELTSCIEEIKKNGDVFILKVDGERDTNYNTIISSFPNSDKEMIRYDSSNLKEAIKKALFDYISM